MHREHYRNITINKRRNQRGYNVNFDIVFEDNEVTIECDWDYGYGGSGIERIVIPIETIERVIADYRNNIRS